MMEKTGGEKDQYLLKENKFLKKSMLSFLIFSLITIFLVFEFKLVVKCFNV